MTRRTPDGTRKRHQRFQLSLDTTLLDYFNFPSNLTRTHHDLSALVNKLLAEHIEREKVNK